MTAVREAALTFLRQRGMTTIFGNPGSTERPMLADQAARAPMGDALVADVALTLDALLVALREPSSNASPQVEGAPGLDLPAVDVAATAGGHGVAATTVAGRHELHDALGAALQDAGGPRLVQVGVRPGMALV